MPIYEYRCRECGYQKEFLQRMSDAPLIDCPECGKPALGKMVSAAGFQLKGTGWYATDFKSSGAKPAAKQDQSAAKQDQSAAKQDQSAAKQDKPAVAKDKPAEGSSKASSKTESSTSAGAPPT